MVNKNITELLEKKKNMGNNVGLKFLEHCEREGH